MQSLGWSSFASRGFLHYIQSRDNSARRFRLPWLSFEAKWYFFPCESLGYQSNPISPAGANQGRSSPTLSSNQLGNIHLQHGHDGWYIIVVLVDDETGKDFWISRGSSSRNLPILLARLVQYIFRCHSMCNCSSLLLQSIFNFKREISRCACPWSILRIRSRHWQQSRCTYSESGGFPESRRAQINKWISFEAKKNHWSR